MNNSGFTLVSGYGIFPTSSILQVKTNTVSSYSVNISPPFNLDSEFEFEIIRSSRVSIFVEKAGSKKNDVEELEDIDFVRRLDESLTIPESSIYEMLSELKDTEFPRYIKDYRRRQKKQTEYQVALEAIQANPTLPDYSVSLDALKQNVSYVGHKQEKTLQKISNLLTKMFPSDSLVEENDKLDTVALFQSEETDLDKLAQLKSKILREFYARNFADDPEIFVESDLSEEAGYYDDEDPDNLYTEEGDLTINNIESEDIEKSIMEADAIRTNPDTVRNIT